MGLRSPSRDVKIPSGVLACREVLVEDDDLKHLRIGMIEKRVGFAESAVGISDADQRPNARAHAVISGGDEESEKSRDNRRKCEDRLPLKKKEIAQNTQGENQAGYDEGDGETWAQLVAADFEVIEALRAQRKKDDEEKKGCENGDDQRIGPGIKLAPCRSDSGGLVHESSDLVASSELF